MPTAIYRLTGHGVLSECFWAPASDPKNLFGLFLTSNGYFNFWGFYQQIYLEITSEISLRTGENRTGEPRPSTRGPFRGHLRGMFRGESLKGWKQGNQPSWVLSWEDSWGHSWGHSWTHSWGHSWAHSWVEVRFRLFCASSTKVFAQHTRLLERPGTQRTLRY